MTLNILWLTIKRNHLVCLNYGHYLERAVAKIANCRWAGRNWPTYRPNESVDETVKRVMPDADWVILYDFESELYGMPRIPKNENRRYGTATILVDIHRNPPRNIVRLNGGNFDVFLMAYRRVAMNRRTTGKGVFEGIEPVNSDIYDALNGVKHHLPLSVEPTIFKPQDKPQKTDVFFAACIDPRYYPLRNKMYSGLKRLSGKGYKIVRTKRPAGRSLYRDIYRLSKKNMFVGEKYVQHIADSRVFPFDTSIFRYPLLRFFEGMACRSCVFSDTPFTADELHLKPDRNFVEVDAGNWENKLVYYLENEGERRKVARGGYEMTLKYHTNEVRARELVDLLESVER